MSRRAEAVAGFKGQHKVLGVIGRLFEGLGWLVAVVGIVACGLTASALGTAISTLVASGAKSDTAVVLALATPFFSGVMILFSGLMVVAYGQIMRAVTSIEANTQASFLVLDRRIPNPHPDLDLHSGSGPGSMDSY